VLERHFSTKPPAAAGGSKKATPADGRTVTVLVLDEMDYLVTAKQTVLYNLFDWPTRNSLHGLVVIGIANTINLPERLLPRVQSRLGLLRLTFKAYTVEQMVSILKTRLSESDASGCFENGALEFAARKTVGLSGDVRRAFQVCQEAAKSVMEAAETASTEAGAPPPKTTVTVRAVVNAVKAMTDVPQLQSIRSCTDLEALLIVSLAAMLASTGREEGGIGVAELRTKMSGSAAALGDQKCVCPRRAKRAGGRTS
jgi:origin recognition complex subunit 1